MPRPGLSVFIALFLLLIPLGCTARAGVSEIDAPSLLLTRFTGSPVIMRADVLVPDSYARDTTRRYPVVYVIHAFHGTFQVNARGEREWQRAIHEAGRDFIVVFLDASCATGEHEFADSANNGPWGTALTTEFIPAIDAKFRTLADGDDRFLYGHSSGGWAALWLQIAHPEMFAGAWAIAPDPVDFADFTGPDLTRTPPGNFYHDERGNEYGFVRVNGHDTTTLRRFVHQEEATGRGNQFQSFEAVFSPRGSDGKPESLFNRNTGAIDPNVAAYWVSHYDIARILRDRWPQLGPELKGKLHITIGTEDTFHLDGSVRLLQTELQQRGSDARITFVPGADHWQVLGVYGSEIADSVRAMQETLVSERHPAIGK